MITVVRAAAGCGKTTELACRYLALVAEGFEVERIVAITFTRRAAAELVERIGTALRCCLGADPAVLGWAWPRYRDAAPSDPALLRAALAGLGHAPIGTTDSFIHDLLSAFALDLRWAPRADEPVPLDIPIRAASGVHTTLTREARRVLDPTGATDPDVALLLRHLTLGELQSQLVQRSPLDHLPICTSTALLQFLSEHSATLLERFDLRRALRVSGDWSTAVRANTNQAGQWTVEAVLPWLSGGGEVPWQLASWLRAMDRRSRDRKAIWAAAQALPVDLGMAEVPLARILEVLEHPFEEANRLELADAVRTARERLRQRVVADGLTAAARAGELGHDELLEAATHLVEQPSERLHARYDALLVDEVQDANPGQLRFYRALCALRSLKRAVFVGDARQAIYLFRGGEPDGLTQLAARADDAVELAVNHRSTPALVAAHRGLFGALDRPLASAGLRPLDDLSGLQAAPANAAHVLGAAHTEPAPVWLVTPRPGEQVRRLAHDTRTLDAFLERVQTSWTEEGRPGDTAAVLVSGWRDAHRACAWLRRRAGRDDVAFVDGGRWRTAGRVWNDVQVVLRALSDPTDDIAWLGLWKHPMVGLSDGALARVRAGVGLGDAPEWCRVLGHLLAAEALEEPHDPDDRAAFARARPLLVEARTGLGRVSTGDVLDRLATGLAWRTVLAAGPGGRDDVAELDAVIDQIHGLDAEGVPARSIVRMLRDGVLEPPRVRPVRPERHIVCTTVFQAKGLAWDHVCVLGPGRAPRGGGDPVETPAAWIRIGGAELRLAGVRIDPDGALDPAHDPVGRVARRLARLRSDEECVRLAYVALTRARRSVTVSLPSDHGRLQDVEKVIARTWGGRSMQVEGVVRVPRDALEDPPPRPHACAVVRHPLPNVPAIPSGWLQVAPSQAAYERDAAERAELADHVRARILLTGGFRAGGEPVDPPEMPGFARNLQGDLAHAWLARWRFAGKPSRALAEELAAEQGWPGAADWLLALSAQLAHIGGPLWELVRHPDSTLHFEWPLVGVDGNRLLAGRVDLLVERGGRYHVVDFKAGEKQPASLRDLTDGASLQSYAPQLESYRAALDRMGLPVDQLALWFVRSATSVSW